MKYLKIIIIFLIFNFNLDAVSIRLLSNQDEILNQKFVRLLVKLDSKDILLKNPIIFSINDSVVDVKNYKILIEPESLHIPSFHQNKKVFNRSFSVDLFFNELNENLQDDSFLFMQYLVLNSLSKSVNAETLKISLNECLVGEKDITSLKDSNLRIGAKVKKRFLNVFLAKKFFNQNLKIKDTVQYLKDQIVSTFKFIPFLFFMILLSFFVFLGIAKVFKQKRFIVTRVFFIKEVLIFIFFASFAGVLFHLKSLYPNKYLFIFIAIYFCVVSCYYFATLKKLNSFDRFIRLMLAISFGAFVLPLIIEFALKK